MCCCRVRLMWSSIAASVVVLPEPVAPVTSTRPRCSSASRLHAGREAERLEARDLARDHAERERDRAALAEGVDAEARQPVDWYAVSSSPLESKSATPGGVAARDDLEDGLRCASVRVETPSSATSLPSLRTIGGWPTFRWTSLAFRPTAAGEQRIEIHGGPPPSASGPCGFSHQLPVTRASERSVAAGVLPARVPRSDVRPRPGGGPPRRPHTRNTGDRPADRREAVERRLRAPRRPAWGPRAASRRARVLVEPAADDRLARELGRHERLVDAVPGKRSTSAAASPTSSARPRAAANPCAASASGGPAPRSAARARCRVQRTGGADARESAGPRTASPRHRRSRGRPSERPSRNRRAPPPARRPRGRRSGRRRPRRRPRSPRVRHRERRSARCRPRAP